MAKVYNLARVTSATTGTGTVTLGAVVPGFLTFAQAGVADGDVVSYGIKDGTNSEVGTGTYTASGPTLTRTPTKSTNAGAAISLSGAAEIYITLRAEDIISYDAPQSLTAPQQQQGRQNIYAAPFDAMAYNGLQINGAMEVSQELGATGRATAGYVCDGWRFDFSGTMVCSTVALPAVLGPFPCLLYVTDSTAQASLGAGDYVRISQKIEGWRVARLQWGTASAQPITIGFWSAHHQAGVYSGVIRNGATNRSYAFTYTHAVVDASQYNTVTIPGDTAGTWANDNTTGLEIIFAMACGTTFTAPSANTWLAGNYYAAPGQINGVAAANNIVRFSGVIILPGSEAPSAARSAFVMRPYDQELQICKRYWEKSYNYATLPGTAVGAGNNGIKLGGLSASWLVAIPYTVEKRAAPTVTCYDGQGTPGMMSIFSGSWLNGNAAAAGGSGATTKFVSLSCTGSVTYIGFDYTADARL